MRRLSFPEMATTTITTTTFQELTLFKRNSQCLANPLRQQQSKLIMNDAQPQPGGDQPNQPKF